MPPRKSDRGKAYVFADKVEFVRYAMIENCRDTHPVANLCGLLKVAKSGYHTRSRSKVIPAKKLEDQRLLAAIRAAHECGRGIYGPKKIQAELAHKD